MSSPALPSIPPGVEYIPSIVYGDGQGIPLVLELARPKASSQAPRPAVVFIHGGGWSAADRSNGTPLILLLAENGFVAVSIDYRLSAVAAYPAQLDDSKCAVRFLRAHVDEYGIDPDRIGVMGGSAGGHLAAMVALTADEKSMEGNSGWEEFSSEVSAVADLYGVSDLPGLVQANTLNGNVEQLMRGTFEAKAESYRQASPLTWVKAGAPPFYITHGDQDKLVPIDQSERLAEALRKVGSEVTYRVMTGIDHGSIGTLPDYVRTDIVSFFSRTLGPV